MAGLLRSSELVEDSIINIVDEVTRDLAYGMAEAEDKALIVGNAIYPVVSKAILLF